jgi:hypothetical protein
VCVCVCVFVCVYASTSMRVRVFCSAEEAGVCKFGETVANKPARMLFVCSSFFFLVEHHKYLSVSMDTPENVRGPLSQRNTKHFSKRYSLRSGS